MATSQAGKKPAPPKNNKKPAAPKKAAGKAAPAKSKEPLVQLGLTLKQQRFVDEYLIDLNASQAAVRAGYSKGTAGSIGHENLKKPEIQLAITEARKRQQERTQINADTVVMQAWNIITADPRELVDVKVGCCRCCHGDGFKLQRTIQEFNHDREIWLDKGNDPSEFDEQGGIGFNPLLPPNPECPECSGDGRPRIALKDTRLLSPKALALYAGAKQTKFGIEIQMHDKAAYAEKLWKHLGLYEKDNEQKTDPLTALLNRIAQGNGNGFRPVQNDPEAPVQPPVSGITPSATTGHDDDDD